MNQTSNPFFNDDNGMDSPDPLKNTGKIKDKKSDDHVVDQAMNNQI